MIKLRQVLRSPFSVLRSPFSVLRSPFSVSSLLLVLIILPGLIACGNPAGDGDLITGLVTFNKLPYGYSIGACQVNSDPGIPCSYSYGTNSMQLNITHEEWVANMIGAGTPDMTISYLSVADPYNKSTIFGVPTDKEIPFAYSGEATVFALIRTSSDPDEFFIRYFNNVNFSGGHAVIDFVDFEIPETEGKFTLTGIPEEHRGKYAILIGTYGTGNNATALYGLKSATSRTAFKGFEIPASDTAEIPVFKLDTGALRFNSFSEDTSVTGLTIIIQEDEDFDFLEYSKNLTASPPVIPPHLVYTDVYFNNGIASEAFGNGTKLGGL